MLVIGLTGGIGSGKSTVAKLFIEKGITVIDTDQLSRDVTQIGNSALAEIVNQFGKEMLHEDGSLNRTELRKKIFKDDQSRLWLEKLLHPLIRLEMKSQIEKSKSTYCIVVIPLLLETDKNPLINRILVVDTPIDEQIKRTKSRDNVTESDVRAIINTQVNRVSRLQAADDIIENTGSLKDLQPQVDRLHGFYEALSLKNN